VAIHKSKMAEVDKTGSKNAAFLVAIWAAILVTVFVAFRSTDLLRLPSMLGNLVGGALFAGEGILASIVGAVVSCLILVSWFGTGTFVFRYLKTERNDNHSCVLEIVRNIAVGAAITSLLWFFLGLAGLFSPIAAVIITVVGLVEGGLSFAVASRITACSRVDRGARSSHCERHPPLSLCLAKGIYRAGW
jgi:hypothetical protein